MFFPFPLPIGFVDEPRFAPPLPAPVAIERSCSVPARGPAGTPPVWLVARMPSPPSTFEEAGVVGKPVEVWRDPDGLFYVNGLINGHRVRFLIDTGASMIVLTEADARAVGASADGSSVALEADTANGKSAMARVTLESIEVAGTGASRVPAAVAKEGLQVSLLGQNWLSHVASVTIQGDRMLLR